MVYKKALEYCKKSGIFDLINESNAIIVGFSGGADSTVLLSFFDNLRETFPKISLIAAHVNHMIRGDEADRDEAFCKGFCLERGITFESARIDVPAIAKNSGMGLEECAREARYSFFEELSKKYPRSLIATAHNADDNLETVIFHIARGSGTKGISGIAPIRDKKLIRPLLSCTSEEIRAFAKDNEIDFVTDSTNLETVYTRNSIRHGIAPLLYNLNPRAQDAALRLSEAARSDCDFIEKEAEKILADGVTRERLADLHPALFQRVILALFQKRAGTFCDLSEKNIRDCRTLVSSTKNGSISLPRQLAFFADKNEVYIEKDPKYLPDNEKTADSPILLQPNVPIYFSDFCILLGQNGNYVNIIDENVYKLSLHERLDYGKIYGNVWIRLRRPGDVLRKGGMSRKLKKLLCDADIPLRIRNSLPIAEDENGIICVPYIGTRDGVTPCETTKEIINLSIFEKKA